MTDTSREAQRGTHAGPASRGRGRRLRLEARPAPARRRSPSACSAGAGWFIMIGAIVVMIFLHELGHYLTAKWSGMKVTEFFLFFGPKIWSFQRGETEYGIKCIPLGAYVRIIGMSNIDQDVAARGRAPHLPAAVVPEAAARRVGRLDHALPPGLRPFFIVFCILGVPGNDAWPQRLGGPSPTRRRWTVGQRRTTARPPRRPASRSATRSSASTASRVTTFDDVGDARRAQPRRRVDVVVAPRRREPRARRHPRHAAATEARGPGDKGFLGISDAIPSCRPSASNPVARRRRSRSSSPSRPWASTVTGLVGVLHRRRRRLRRRRRRRRQRAGAGTVVAAARAASASGDEDDATALAVDLRHRPASAPASSTRAGRLPAPDGRP